MEQAYKEKKILYTYSLTFTEVIAEFLNDFFYW